LVAGFYFNSIILFVIECTIGLRYGSIFDLGHHTLKGTMSMNERVTRRDFLKLTGAAGGTFLLTGCSKVASGERTFWDRVMGNPITQSPQIEGAWTYAANTLTLDLSKLPEIGDLGGAVRIEGEVLPEPIVVVYGEDGNYYAFKNACTHAGRMIDPVAGTMTLECCSVSSSTFDYQGNVLSGPAEGALTSYPLVLEEEQLIISLN
jgi:nitrite reductase/ring-hydroxylating ferredoxin subunit